jgi:hypothetical protein
MAVGRVFLITFLATLISFAISLFFGIVTIVLANMFKGGGIDMAHAYRDIAFPVAIAVMVVAFTIAVVNEIRTYRRVRRELQMPFERAA